MAAEHFQGLGERVVDEQAQDLHDLGMTLQHWTRTTSQLLRSIALFEAKHGLTVLLAEAGRAKRIGRLRAMWPILQAANVAMGRPQTIKNLPTA